MFFIFILDSTISYSKANTLADEEVQGAKVL